MDLSSVTIAGSKFDLRNPFEAGYTLSQGEANALNQLRHENVRNNCAKLVKDWKGSLDDLAIKVDEYDRDYAFNVREPGEGRAPSDPIGTEAKQMARDAIKAALEAAGQKADRKQIEAAVGKLLEHPEKGAAFRARAEERINERKRVAAEILGNIDVSSISAPAA